MSDNRRVVFYHGKTRKPRSRAREVVGEKTFGKENRLNVKLCTRRCERFEHFRLLNFRHLGRQVLSLRKCDQTVRKGGGIGWTDSWFDFPKVSFPQPLPVPANAASVYSVVKQRHPSDMGSKMFDSAKHFSQHSPSPAANAASVF